MKESDHYPFMVWKTFLKKILILLWNSLQRSLMMKVSKFKKRSTHTLIQIARSRPAEVYPYVQELLKDADDRRVKTIWVSMKKLANSLKSTNSKEKNGDFVLLTKNTIKDWRSDKNKKFTLWAINFITL